MSYSLPPTHRERVDMFRKGGPRSVFMPRASVSYRQSMYGSEFNDTEFEEDMSDFEDYAGRRSEDSGGKRSETTISSLDELTTPNTQNGFDGFNFHISDLPGPEKSVEGPVGPHLFRLSQASSLHPDIYLSMSPPVSPDEVRAAPAVQRHQPAEHAFTAAPRTSVPLRTWTPWQVAEWMNSLGFERAIIDRFFVNDISGVTLIDLQYEDLKELGIASFGQRHRLWTEIKALKDLNLSHFLPPTPDFDAPWSPAEPGQVREETHREPSPKKCSSPEVPAEQDMSSTPGRRRPRRGRLEDDIISPAESASIVAIEQLLPKPHKCSKGENCAKWQKQQRKLARIATEFPLEMAQLADAKRSPGMESGLGATSIIVPSVIASSDLLGPAAPKVRLEEGNLMVVQSRDPQENVRQFLDFQHMAQPVKEEATTPPYEMFPPLSPPKAQAPHTNLRSLPKLTIPTPAGGQAFSPRGDRTAVPIKRTPVTAFHADRRPLADDIYRMGSPASEMDVPVTALPIGPVERDVSSSVPPDMRYGGNGMLSRSSSRVGHRPPPAFVTPPSRNLGTLRRSTSHAGNRAAASTPHFAPIFEHPPTPIEDLTPTDPNAPHAGWMRKRRTKMLRHEWQESHFRLNGTCLAMHKDENAAKPVECIDVDDYAVAVAANNNKINAAMKRLNIGGKKKEGESWAYGFQLTPAAEKKGMLHAATGKTHHFAVQTANERIDWMRELMLARAKKGKDTVHTSFG